MMWRPASQAATSSWWPGASLAAGQPRACVEAGRARFVRRVLLASLRGLLFLSAIGVATLVSKLFGGRGPDRASNMPPVDDPAIGLFLVGLLAVAMRRIAHPLGDIVEAANRSLSGDYSARITEMVRPRCERWAARSTAWPHGSNRRSVNAATSWRISRTSFEHP